MYKFALLLIIVVITHSQSRYADFPTEKDVIIHENLVDNILTVSSNIPLVEMTKTTSSALPHSIHDAELTELPEIELVSLPIKKEIKYRIHDVYKKDTNSLNDWDKFCKSIYLAAKDIKEECPNIPLSEIYLYDYLMKVVYAECKYNWGVAEREVDGVLIKYNRKLAKNSNSNITERNLHRSIAYSNGINWRSDARGIIQFMPRIRKKYGVPHNINEYPLHKQVPYLKKYYINKLKYQWTSSKGGNLDLTKIDNFMDIYCITFAPATADDHDNATMYSSGKAYAQNRRYDRNNDGIIKKREVANYIINKHFK